MSRQIRVVRLGFEDDERPRRVILTPTIDYLLGSLTAGVGFNAREHGPVSVSWHPPGQKSSTHYPVHLATISQPWSIIDVETYEAMGGEV